MANTLRNALILGATLSAISSATWAHQSGTVIGRAGPVLVEPQEESSNVRITNPALGEVSGAKVGVDPNAQLGLTATYMFTDHIGLGLLAATPFEHDIYATDAIAGVGKLGSTKHLPPTLSVEFYLNDPDSDIQPYFGVGLNYTMFFSEKTTDTLTGAVGVLASIADTPVAGVEATSSKLELDDSIGASLTFGIDYAINENWGINAAMWWIDIETEATITAETNAGTVTAKADVEIDPFAYMVGVSYRF